MTMESLPIYIEDQAPQDPYDALLTRISAPLLRSRPNARVLVENFIESLKAPSYDTSEKPRPTPKPIDSYFDQSSKPTDLCLIQESIIKVLYDAITKEDNDSIDLLIQRNILSPNVTGCFGQTPLLAAVMTKNIKTVKQLLDLGADPNMFGQATFDDKGGPKEQRTPLMLAAKLGSLPIVRLLVDDFSADHSLVAPDGQIALRLAVENQHRVIVEYLPSLRAGGLLRFKTRNAYNIARAKKAFRKIYYFMKFFLWDVPKFFLWSFPKYVVVLPSYRACKWGWENRRRFANWCKRQAIEFPKKLWRGIKKVPDTLLRGWKSILKGLKKLGPILWNFVKTIFHAIIDFIKALPETVSNILKNLWKFVTRTLPQWLKSIATCLWDIFTKDIPKAIHAVVKWIWEVLKSSAEAIWEFLSSIVSFLHTLFTAIITFLINATLRDIWNAFCRILRSIFINIPKTLWSWLKSLSILLYDVMNALFGWFGRFVWEVGAALFRAITYIPKKLWIVLESAADSMGKAAHEIRVWIDPKA